MAQNYSETEMAAHLTQVRCKRFEMQTAPGTGDREMTVFWEVSHNKVSEAVAFLDKYGVPENHATATVTQLLTDPVVDNEPYAGKWRVVRNWFDHQMPGKVFQTRRLGWLTTLLTGAGAVDWTEAKIVSGRDHLVFASPVANQTDDYLVLEWRNIQPGSGPTLAKELVTKAAAMAASTPAQFFTPLGDTTTYGSAATWRLLPVSHQTAQDGSSVLTAAFVKLGVTETAYGNIGSEVETVTITERVTEDQMQARVNALKAEVISEGSTVKKYSDVVPSRGADGICQIRYTKLVPVPGVIYYTATPEAGQTEYHKIAWEQDSADLDWNGTGFTPGTAPSITTAQLLRRVAGVRRNPQTQKWSYHVVISDGGEQIPTHPAAALVTYRSQFFERRMWSISNNMYWDQRKITVWKHETLIFTTYAAANAWMGADTATNPSYFLDGEPVWTGTAPNLPPQEGTAPPRLIGVNKWLAQRRTVSWDSGYYPPEPT
jgi:hypothetical protein